MVRGSAIAGMIAALFWCALGASTASAADSGCAQAAAAAVSMADSTTLRQASDSVLCLVNALRAHEGLRPLRASRSLNRSALRHSRDMVDRQYFSHVTPNGTKPRQRMSRSGYRRKHRNCRVGETIAWGTDLLATPAELVQAFMNSRPHRRILLDKRYRDIGVGLVLGAPIGDAVNGATLTLHFGRR